MEHFIAYLIYLFLATGSIVAALGVVFLRNTIYGALSLVVTMLCLAGVYLLVNAPFVALIQVLVYAGAIMVLFLYVIMLLNPRRLEPIVQNVIERRFWLVLLFLGFFVPLIVTWLWRLYGTMERPERWELVPVKSLATRLLTDFLLPFELTSVLLLVAIIGAVLIAKRD